MTMVLGALLAAAAGFGTAALTRFPEWPWLSAGFAGSYYLLSVAHAGVRLGRKTHLIDMATADNRASYVAVSNTFIGVMLLLGGAFGGLASAAGPAAAILVLSLLSLAAAAVAWRLQEVQ
jgi:hypothetical protein